ncbi:hypothetical protein LTR84_000220 [Exophiala bonariae]|uniref:N-alpha-acetyltransferase 40 n=1 Tax=Exophiala bonariae TaxID=1690606 RepID=A0AAV9NTH2_9EURO|nr:hypothetical protein LTR84_000220 [Exophiala bonariae]
MADSGDSNNNTNQTSRRLRSKAQEKAITQGKLVETTNSLTCVEFFDKFALELPLTPQVKNTGNALIVDRAFEDASTISKHVHEKCLDLIEQTSAHDYRNSETGWSRSKKKKEMKLPDMKYIIFKDERSEDVAGFVSFMVTYEDGFEVIYVYEIHLAAEWQAQGLGKSLMLAMEAISKNVGVEKVMLTVFKSNHRAVDWYRKLGYVEDEFSPQARKLRNGTVKESTYIILSKALKK